MNDSGNTFQAENLCIYDSTFTKTEIGNTVQVHGALAFFDVPRNPGNFDQRFYNRKQGIEASVMAERVAVTDASENWIGVRLAAVKERWKNLLLQHGEQTGAFLSAVLLGEKGELEEETKELYQKCGIGHILAISGLHLSFIGIGIYKILRKAGVPIWFAAISGSFILWFYLMMIGFPVSALRAYIMYVIRMGSLITGRKYDAATALAISAVVTLVREPLYLLDAGFLLSYGAILGIIVILPLLEQLFLCKSRWLSGLKASLAVNIVLLPLLLYFYFEFPLYSLILNLVVVPLMSVVMAAGMAGTLISGISPTAGSALFGICRVISQGYEWLGKMTMKLPMSRIVTGKPERWQVILYYVILSGVVWGLGRRIRRKESRIEKVGMVKANVGWERGIGIISLMILMFLISFRAEKDGEVHITMVDVGQGDGIFIQGPTGNTYFVDGGSSDVMQVGKYRIEPFLKSQGAGTLDYIFISHGDTDHFSGIMELLERQTIGIRIINLVLSPQDFWDENLYELARAAVMNGTNVCVWKPGECIKEEELELTCIQPAADYGGEIGNASSMVLELQYKEFDMLFTGDVEGEGEQILKDNLKGKNYDVLKVAHHGSKNSGDEEFIDQVTPSYALISAGVENRYGHPHIETLERLNNCGSEIYCTAEHGAIMLWTDGKEIRIVGQN